MGKQSCILAGIGAFCVILGIYVFLANSFQDNNSSNALQPKVVSEKGEFSEKTTKPINYEPVNNSIISDIGSDVYASSQDSTEIDAAIDLEEKLTVSEAQARIAERGENSQDTVADLIEEIKSSKKLTEQCKEILSRLKEQGVDCEKALLELYKEDGNTRQQGTIITALESLATEKAREGIIEIAKNPGRSAYTMGRQAVAALTRLTNDTTVISQCLESTSPDTRDYAAQELAGKELSSIAVSRLGELLKSDSWVSHNLVATAFTTDTSNQMTREKLNLILNSIPKAESVITLNKNGLLTEFPWNSQEMTMQSYLSALSGIQGGESYLEGKLAKSEGLSQQIIILSLANRNEDNMREKVLQIINETDNGFIRTKAIDSLAKIGNADDIELLKRIKESDTFKRRYHRHGESSERDHYPARKAAEEAIELINKRS